MTARIVPGAKLIDALDGLLPFGVEPGDVLLMLGMKYRSALRALERNSRRDLAERLMVWKQQDNERLKHALGRTHL